MKITYEIARAAAMDAANRRMKAEGRMVWNQEDYNEACRELERLWPSTPKAPVEES